MPEPHTLPDPFPKLPSSVWDAVFPRKAFPWRKWPHAPNFLVDKEVWACEGGWIAQLKFSVFALNHLFWTSFVPSPIELERKLFLGSYKCGFYLLPGFKSPMEVLIGEDGVSLVAKIARPATKLLFYWWAAETLYSALDTAHSILHRDEFCEETTKLFWGDDAHTFFEFDIDSAPVGVWNPKHDPGSVCGGGCVAIAVPAGEFSAHFTAHFEAFGLAHITEGSIWLEINGIEVPLSRQNFSSPNQRKNRMVNVRGTLNEPATIVPMFSAKVSGATQIFDSRIVGDDFVVSWAG